MLLNASDLTVYDGRALVATHERLLTKGGACLDPGPPPLRRSSAYPVSVRATALEQVSTAGTFYHRPRRVVAAACTPTP